MPRWYRNDFSNLCVIYPHPPNVVFTPPGLTTQKPVGQMSVGEQQAVEQNTRQKHKGDLSECLFSTMSGHCQRKHRTKHKGHILGPSIEMKKNWSHGGSTRAAGLEGKDSTDHAMTTVLVIYNFKLFISNKEDSVWSDICVGRI